MLWLSIVQKTEHMTQTGFKDHKSQLDQTRRAILEAKKKLKQRWVTTDNQGVGGVKDPCTQIVRSGGGGQCPIPYDFPHWETNRSNFGRSHKYALSGSLSIRNMEVFMCLSYYGCRYFAMFSMMTDVHSSTGNLSDAGSANKLIPDSFIRK